MYTYVHGGDIYTASGKKNLADYSANINPLGLPQSVKKAIVKSIAGCADYPDPFCRRLTEKLAGFLAVPGEYIFSATVQQMYCLNWRCLKAEKSAASGSYLC